MGRVEMDERSWDGDRCDGVDFDGLGWAGIRWDLTGLDGIGLDRIECVGMGWDAPQICGRVILRRRSFQQDPEAKLLAVDKDPRLPCE